MNVTYGFPEEPADLHAVHELHARAFGFPVEDSAAWIARWTSEVRVLRAGDRVAATLLRVPMGQHFGGKSVPMLGIAGVATDPTLRGGGLGTHLMRAAMNEARRDGFPLSVLYAATQPLYRRAGYEQAGAYFRLSCEPAALKLGDRGLPVRAVPEAERAGLQAIYAEVAKHRPGSLDRGPYVWSRVFAPRGAATEVYAAGDEGYVVITRKRTADSGPRHELHLTDLVARTPRAASRLLSFLADFSSMSTRVSWHGTPADALFLLPREQNRLRVELEEHWMLRLCDVRSALTLRGYPAAVRGEVHLSIEDEVVAENRGRIVLTVEGGRATVREGGEGRVTAHVRGLAPVYSGLLSAVDASRTGLLDGPVDDLLTLGALFAGPAPAMSDLF